MLNELKKNNKDSSDVKELEDLTRREGMFKDVLEIDPEDAMANCGMGDIQFKRGNFSQSIDYYKAALKTDQQYSVAYLGLGKSLESLQKTSEALDVIRKALKWPQKEEI